MIGKLTIFRTDGTNPYRNLALEEYLTFHTEPGECILYLWQNKQTVVIGKNQNCWRECRVTELERDGGHLSRRLSGGGAVYHDLGNLNFTFCVRKEDYDVGRQLQVIEQAVRSLGMDARRTGRNDIAIEGRKFSGNAFYRSGDFCYHHGTILMDVDKNQMSRYLNVSREKLNSNGVASVRSRVVNLRELRPGLTLDELVESLFHAFSQVYGFPSRPLEESRIDQETVRRGEERFSSWDWKYGRNIRFQYSGREKFPWGEVELQFQVDGGVIREVNVFSDGMEEHFFQELQSAWRGCRYEAGVLLERLAAVSPGLPGEAPLAEQMKRDIGGLLEQIL